MPPNPHWPMPLHHPNCRCALVPVEPPCEAEHLLRLADRLALPRERLLLYDGGFGPATAADLALARLALELRRVRPALRLRALCEGWSRERIIRELW